MLSSKTMIEEYIGKDVAPLSLSFRVLSSLNALCLSVVLCASAEWTNQSARHSPHHRRPLITRLSSYGLSYGLLTIEYCLSRKVQTLFRFFFYFIFYNTFVLTAKPTRNRCKKIIWPDLCQLILFCELFRIFYNIL